VLKEALEGKAGTRIVPDNYKKNSKKGK
jgi:hypothetical protein